jgi:formate dehydrogenase major subunit
VRTGFGTNNVDHCTRLCHASSVVALLEGIGSGAVSNQVSDVAESEVIFLIGANPTSNHPVAATWIKNAVERGAKLILADPRRNDLARHAWRFLQFTADMDVALLNAMIHTILEEKLVAEDFVRKRTSGYEALRENARDFSPEKMAPLCGIPAETDPRGGARLRHVEGLDHPLGHGHLAARARHRQRALPDRADAHDRPDRPPGHRAASAARAEQRAGRVGRGPHPDDVPDYQRVDNPGSHRALREVLGPHARPQGGPHRRRDHGRGLRRQDQGHVHHGREPGDVGPEREPRARGTRRSSTCWSCRTSSSPRPRTSPT